MTFASWLPGLVRTAERTPRTSRRPDSGSRRSALRLAVEVLEDRTVPSTVSFSAAQTFPNGGSSPLSVAAGAVAVGDFDGDGHADLAVGHSGSNTVGVPLGDGSGGFAPAATFASGGSGARFIAVGDFNGDG